MNLENNEHVFSLILFQITHKKSNKFNLYIFTNSKNNKLKRSFVIFFHFNYITQKKSKITSIFKY